MPDTAVTSLDARQQKLVENARRALTQGNLDYVLTACGQVLQSAPGCLTARRLQRAAQKGLFSRKGGWMAKALSGLTAFPASLGGGRRAPAETLAQAEKILAKDPFSRTGLEWLAEAALAHDWPETAAFAFESIRELEPDDRVNLIALGDAWLRAGRPDEALSAADTVLRLHPVDAEAQNLMRRASIARTTRDGNWDQAGNYRQKLKDEERAAALEQNARLAAPVPRAVPSAAASAELDPLAAARDLVARYPGDLDARFRLAELLFSAGDVEPAIAQFQQAQRSPKLRIPSLLGLARCFRARGLVDLAVAQLTTAKAELPVMDDLKKEVVYELGVGHEQLKQPEAAIAQFKEIYAEDIGFRDVAAKVNAYYASS